MPNIKADQKEKARYLYFNTNKTQRAIAKVLEIAEQTMSIWVREGDWANEKKATYYSPEQEIHHLYEELREINNNILQRDKGKRFATKEELETKTKILALINAQLKNEGAIARNVAPDFHFGDISSEKADREMAEREKLVNQFR